MVAFIKVLFVGFVLSFFLSSNTNAQEITLKGLVQEAKTKEVVPFAHIGISGSNLGTVSNADGQFMLKVPQSFAYSTLQVSFMGYETYKIKLSQISNRQNIVILLKESSLMLDKVTVSTETPAQIVEKAYQNIPQNFPNTNTLYTGFYRESNLHHKENQAEQYFYMIEAVLKMNKPSYEKRLPRGNIKVEKVRKKEFVGDTINFGRWMAGAFTPTRFDVAKKRFDFIEKTERYQYKLKDYTTYYDKLVFIIEFLPAKNAADYQGILYIDTETYAIVKVDYQYSPKGLIRANADRSEHSVLHKRAFKINYQPIDDKWYIESIWQQAKGEDKSAEDNFRYVTEYATTDIQFNKKGNFEYAEKIQFKDVFLRRDTKYDPDFWKNYNIVSETEDLKQILIDTQTKVKIDTSKKIKVDTLAKVKIDTPKDSLTSSKKIKEKQSLRQRFRIVGSIPTFAVVNNNGQNMNLQFRNSDNSFQINEMINLKNTSFAASSGSGFEYDIYKDLFLAAHLFIGMGTFDYGGVQAGLGYKWQLTHKQKRPIRLVLALDYAYSTLLLRVKNYDNSDPKTTIKGETFDKNKFKVEFFSRQHNLLPKIAFELEITHRIDIFAEVGYFLPISKKQEGLFFTDGRSSTWAGRSNQKRATIDLDNSNLSLRVDDIPTTKLPFQMNMFLNFGFKSSF